MQCERVIYSTIQYTEYCKALITIPIIKSRTRYNFFWIQSSDHSRDT
jgi:hypothetical protein